ncbi:MAG: HAD-IB family hydrolase [Parachlamydiaceae bacterium]|nr:HAD-IB family hydrolase [Parachlamydiaceae bacterium]
MNSKKALAVFDLDKTLLTVNSSHLFGRYLYKCRYFSFAAMLHHLACYGLFKIGVLSLHTMQLHVFKKLFLGRSYTEINQLAEEFTKQVIAKIQYMPAVQRLRLAQEQGHHTVILSSAPDFLVAHLANYFGVDQWKSTQYALDEEQRFATISTWMLGSDKARCMKQISSELGIQRECVTAYSDSIVDLAFLEAAGTAVAVNPDRHLRKYSRVRQWEII